MCYMLKVALSLKLSILSKLPFLNALFNCQLHFSFKWGHKNAKYGTNDDIGGQTENKLRWIKLCEV